MENDKMQLTHRQEADALISVEQSRAIAEIQAQMIVAKRFPRDVEQCLLNIREACKRKALAQVAQYSYPRGGSNISGPSIRLAEVVAQGWQNLSYGIRELSQSLGESTVEAYAWDLETNVRMSKTFQVKHQRKARGSIRSVDDPRDIYELAANQGARRLRACILAIIPGDIIEGATAQCEQTLAGDEKPMKERVRAMLEAFAKLEVTKKMIEKYLGHNVSEMQPSELVSLQSIFNSIKDGVGKAGDWFAGVKPEAQTSDLNGLVEKVEKQITPETFPEAPPDKEPKKQVDVSVQQVYAMFPAGVANKTRDAFLATQKTGNRLTKAEMRDIIEDFDNLWGNYQISGKVEPAVSEPATSENTEEDERLSLWSRIRKTFKIEEIEDAQTKMGLGVGASVIPPTLDGCQALYDRLAEFSGQDFE